MLQFPKRLMSLGLGTYPGQSKTRLHTLPASFLRGGTSKGVFIKRSDLPQSQESWKPILQGIMGSPDPQYRRQLNGMGGGVSSLSKVCVVGPPSPLQPHVDVDVEYTFVQVGIEDGALDTSGNCGNLSSMIGVFAVDEGLCAPSIDPSTGLATVRSYNTNTSKRIDTVFPVSEDGRVPDLDRPEVEIAGVPGRASRILLKFVDPAGARTGKLLPTGSPLDILEFKPGAGAGAGAAVQIPASLVDATNPTVFVAAGDLASLLGATATDLPFSAEHYAQPHVEEMLENIRQAAAVRMGLSPLAKAQPKIAVLSSPGLEDVQVDVVIHAFSMGVLHKAVPMTVGLCLGVASSISGTLASEIVSQTRSRLGGFPDGPNGSLRIRHPGGVVEVGADFGEDGSVLSAHVVRTGRRLMSGIVWC